MVSNVFAKMLVFYSHVLVIMDKIPFQCFDYFISCIYLKKNATTNCFLYVVFFRDNFSCIRRKQNEDGEDKWTQSWNKSLKLGMDSTSMEQPI